MNTKISPAVAVIIVVVVVGLVVAFGYKKVTGGPDADVTQQVIAHYQQAAKSNPAPGAGAMGGRKDSSAGIQKTGDDAAGAKQYH